MDNDRIAPKDLHKYEPVTRHLADKITGVTFYADRGQPILKVIDSLAEVKRYKIRDFYKPDLVEQALSEVLKSRGLDTVTPKDLRKFIEVKGKGEMIPKGDRYAKMVASLQANPEAVADYFTNYLDSYVVETLKPTLADNVDELLNSTELKEFIPLTDGVYTSKKGDKTKQQGYTVPDQKALEQFIKGKLHPDGKLRKIGTISEGELQQGSTSLESYGDKLKAIADLGEASGINLGEYPDQDKGVITINTAYITLESLLHSTLYQMVKITKAKPVEQVGEGVGREVVNIKDADQHRYIPRPTTGGLMDMITKAVEGKDINDLKERYLDQESRKADGGFLLHIDNPQTALPLAFDKSDITPRQQAKMVANSVALTIQSIGALQAYRRDNPDTDGYIKLKDLAQYVKRYADDMATKGSLRPQYRQQLLNGLTLATLAGTSYIISKDKKTGKARHGVVYLIDRISEYETNKKGDIIAVKTDFTQEYKASLQYNLGVLTDGVQNLERTEPINLATYILDRQVAKQNDTVAGKPITCKADTLCKVAGITDQTVTNRYNTLTKILNELQAEGVAVGRWVTKAKGNTITGYNPESQTLYIYPTETVQNTYITKERSKAIREAYKTEQKGRIKALKKYAKGYTDLDVLAKEMDVTRPELEGLLAGQQPIADELLERIDTDVVSK